MTPTTEAIKATAQALEAALKNATALVIGTRKLTRDDYALTNPTQEIEK